MVTRLKSRLNGVLTIFLHSFQVVSAASAQGLAAGTIRANMSNPPHTIKVSAGTNPQQAIFSLVQQQQQQMQRQNANQNLRLQASTGSLVAVAVQPTQQQQQQTAQTQANQQQTTAPTQSQAAQPQPQVDQTNQSHTPSTTPKRR